MSIAVTALQFLRAFILLFSISLSVSAAEKSNTEDVTIFIGQAKVVRAPSVKRIAVGNGKILSAMAVGKDQVLITAEGIGITTVHIWTASGADQDLRVRVLATDPQVLQREIDAMLVGFENVTARTVGDKVVLEGSNISDEAQGRLKEIQNRFPQVVNFVGKISWEKMIHMDVKVVEFKKGMLEDLGIKWDTNHVPGPSAGFIAEPTMNGMRFVGADASKLLEAGGGAASLPLQRILPPRSYFGIITGISSILKLAVNNGDAVTLAEPKLSCRSGGSAKFLAGGEVPIPVTNKLGATNVTYKEFGVILEIKPSADNSGMISTKIKTEISAIDPSVKVGDFPGFIKRATETEVNLRDGETLVISGFINNEFGDDVQKIAGLGDIPILGALFRSTQFRNNKTEMVMFITPHLVSAGPIESQPEIQHVQERIDRFTEKVKHKMID
ncbi:MAG: pilus assembly protein N-terminal domain-containing protein [Pseudomonadota bacterium]